MKLGLHGRGGDLYDAGSNRLALALQRQLNAGGVGVAAGQRFEDTLRHHDLAGPRLRLQPGCRIDDVAEGGEVLHLATPDIADEGAPVVDADAEREPGTGVRSVA